ncbi:MAG: M1 family peptidase, partial [Gemmatimonadales bacterium]
MRMLLLSLLATTQLAAQQAAAPSQTDSSQQGYRSPFRRLELPTPSRLRTGAGAPGPDYWQQRVDYVIRASLDTAAKAVTGEERITYS